MHKLTSRTLTRRALYEIIERLLKEDPKLTVKQAMGQAEYLLDDELPNVAIAIALGIKAN